MKKNNYLKVFLGLLLVFSIWLFFLNKDVLNVSDTVNVSDPVTDVIITLKENPQMLDVFIDQILADNQLKKEFLHHPWIIESLESDSLFVRQQINLLDRDSTIANYFFYQLSIHRKPMNLLVESLYRNRFINQTIRGQLLKEIAQRRMIDDPN